MSFVVVLDACTLFPASLRDTLLIGAECNIYEIRLTDEILEEVRRNLAHKRMSEENALKLVTTLKATFEEYIVTRHRALIESMPINKNDRHVLAAAVVSNADFIITQNLRHFPKHQLSRFGIEALSPDEFLSDLFDNEPEGMKAVLIKQAGNLHKPSMTVSEVLDVLKQHAPDFVRKIQEKFEFSRDPLWIDEFQIKSHAPKK